MTFAGNVTGIVAGGDGADSLAFTSVLSQAASVTYYFGSNDAGIDTIWLGGLTETNGSITVATSGSGNSLSVSYDASNSRSDILLTSGGINQGTVGFVYGITSGSVATTTLGSAPSVS